MLTGTLRWVLVVEGRVVGDERALQQELLNIGIPLRLMEVVEHSRVVMGTDEQITALLSGFPK
jgi:hypothetical protein